VLNTLRTGIVVFVALTLVTGVAYPAIITLIAQIVFPHQANGSIVYAPEGGEVDDRVRDWWGKGRNDPDRAKTIGSELIGQQFSADGYFWGRPSATGPIPYNAAASTGSNYGPTNPTQLDAVKQRVESLRQSGLDKHSPIPIDLVTASGSGLDPHISPAAADCQVPRIARVRGIDEDDVRRAIAENVEGRTIGLFGEPRINVLRLNLALDELEGSAKE
jgi:potassium-transporting ATPase KdpC subunit